MLFTIEYNLRRFSFGIQIAAAMFIFALISAF